MCLNARPELPLRFNELGFQPRLMSKKISKREATGGLSTARHLHRPRSLNPTQRGPHVGLSRFTSSAFWIRCASIVFRPRLPQF